MIVTRTSIRVKSWRVWCGLVVSEFEGGAVDGSESRYPDMAIAPNNMAKKTGGTEFFV